MPSESGAGPERWARDRSLSWATRQVPISGSGSSAARGCSSHDCFCVQAEHTCHINCGESTGGGKCWVLRRLSQNMRNMHAFLRIKRKSIFRVFHPVLLMSWVKDACHNELQSTGFRSHHLRTLPHYLLDYRHHPTSWGESTLEHHCFHCTSSQESNYSFLLLLVVFCGKLKSRIVILRSGIRGIIFPACWQGSLSLIW